jgi:hypothetical protein
MAPKRMSKCVCRTGLIVWKGKSFQPGFPEKTSREVLTEGLVERCSEEFRSGATWTSP